MTGRKFIVWSESSPNENSWRRTITLPLVKMMVRGADACIAIGSLSKKYFEILGVDPSKIFVAYYTMDLKHFIQNSRMSEKRKMAIKEKMGIQRGKVVLYVGQFIERKGVDYLITAFKKLQTKVPNVSLLLVGYGPQKELLLKRIKDEKIDRVIFQDHIDVEEMPKMYGIADLFVLPSFEEAWGVVVNEAMAAGLPVITTRKVGSSADLVFNNRNGFVIPERNSQALAAALIKILKSPSLRKRMSQESKKIIKNFTPESTAENFLEAIKYSMKP
jgi:glycosyltransferase involved in cell wall biosynthesis